MEVREPSAKYLAHTGYKQTEVGVIPNDWTTVALFALAGGTKERFDDGDWIEAEFLTESGIRLIQTGNIGIGVFIDKESKKYISPHSFDLLRCKALKVGDLLICRLAQPAGRACLFPGLEDDKAITAVDVTIFRPIEELADRRYLLQLFCTPSWFAAVNERCGGSTRTRIARGALGQIPIALPPTKAEQEAIAGALSDADALIESLEQLLAKKRQLKQGAMQQLLTGKKRLPGFGGEWVVKRLGELAKIQRGASPRPIDSPIWFDENSSVGWVRISDVTSSGMYLHETTQRLSPLGIQNSRPVSRGSLIMSICATVGRPIITEIDVCIHDGFVVFDNLRANKHFLYYALKFIEGDWSRHGQTGSQMNLNTGLINRTEVPVPPTTEEQTAVATILSDMDAEIAALEEKLAKARAIKQGMMQELLTGRIRLVHPASNVVPITGEAKSVSAAAKPHNWQINEAVIIAVLAKHFGSEEWPLARKRCTKLTYLLHRYVEREVEGYLKKAAGPYNPATRYKGPEVIAQKNGYVRAHHNGKYEGYVAAENIAEAEAYFAKWYGLDVLAWLERFRLKKTDELELLATVDMAVGELCREGRRVELDAVKQLIHAHPEWQPKLEREIFSDANIARAIRACQELFG